jgi:serine/threonine protein kinase
MKSCPRCRREIDDGVRFCPFDGVPVRNSGENRFFGQLIGGEFELHDICGRGASGTVYRAFQRQMERWVAIKLMHPELLEQGDLKHRFLREARTAARLCHPNIVTVHALGESEGVPYLVMEYVDGLSLEAVCEAEGIQPLWRLVRIGTQVGAALHEAHQAGIVHRDLKPANVVVSQRSRASDFLKVLDFGIAKILQKLPEGSPSTARLTIDGMVFGTPHYIAPEQASGGNIDHRADFYSLGVILFRLATGALPFEAPSSVQVVLRHLRDPPPRPRDFNPSLPKPLEALLLSCLEKRPDDRPQSAEEILGILEQYRDEPGKDASARSLGKWRTSPLRRHLVIGGAALLGCGIGALSIGHRPPRVLSAPPAVATCPSVLTPASESPASTKIEVTSRPLPPMASSRERRPPRRRAEELPVTVVPPSPRAPIRPRPLDGKVIAPARVESPLSAPKFRTEPLPPNE